MSSNSETEDTPQNGINGDRHDSDKALENLDDANDRDLFGDDSDADGDV